MKREDQQPGEEDQQPGEEDQQPEEDPEGDDNKEQGGLVKLQLLVAASQFALVVAQLLMLRGG
ncbi:MAG: hypothetical protein LC808_24535 [Actinobacteria bacterium]|nr:hypothetical protein [Acidobacteriota bacterium]MCA1706259.1 hypothetical protein [Actinomycetota bacterium]